MDGHGRESSRQDTSQESQDEAPRDAARDRHRRNLGFAIGGVIVLILVVLGTLYWLHARHYESTDDAYVEGNTTQLAPQIAGRVTGLLFADNQHVTAGEKLVTIDPRPYQTRLDQAKAAHANAVAQRAQAEARLTEQQAERDQARAKVQVAEAEQVQARKDHARYAAINPRAISQLQLDSATAALRSANARLDAAHQAVDAARAQLSMARARILAAEASVQQSTANVAYAALQLSYCTITAPVSGRVTHRTVNVGDYVNPGQPMFAIVQDGLWITADFKETQIGLMHPGQKVSITIDAFPGKTFAGHVDSFQAGTGMAFSVLPAENATGNYVKVVQRLPVKILFDGDAARDPRLAPGMSAVPTVTVR